MIRILLYKLIYELYNIWDIYELNNMKNLCVKVCLSIKRLFITGMLYLLCLLVDNCVSFETTNKYYNSKLQEIAVRILRNI